MSGQMTGGELLAALEASSTGQVVDAGGVALFLSKDNIAGSSAPCKAKCTPKGGSSKKIKKFTQKKVLFGGQ